MRFPLKSKVKRIKGKRSKAKRSKGKRNRQKQEIGKTKNVERYFINGLIFCDFKSIAPIIC